MTVAYKYLNQKTELFQKFIISRYVITIGRSSKKQIRV